jgi:predicted RNase H-like HicB family nuclease
MMAREFDVVIEQAADGCYVASVPVLAGCCTQACSLDVLMERVREAVLLCLEEQGDAEEDALTFVGIHRVSVDL